MLSVTKEELMNLGYGKYQSEDIIRKAKAVMVSKGYSYYLNKRLGRSCRKCIRNRTRVYSKRG